MVRFSFMRDCGSIPHRDSTVSTLVGQPRRLKLTKNSLTLTKLLTQFQTVSRCTSPAKTYKSKTFGVVFG